MGWDLMYDFHNHQHVSDYLTGSIVKKGSNPVYITGVYDDEGGGNIRVQFCTLPYTGETKVGRVQDLRFNPLPVGMCNLLDGRGMPAEAAYVTRIPARRWKIGLSRYGCYPFPSRQPEERHEYHPWLAQGGPDHGSCWLTTMPGLNMIRKDYPSFDQAMEYMAPYERRSCAFSPNFSVTGTGKLIYRFHSTAVGKCGSTPALYHLWQDLAETLEEDLNGEY